MTFIEWLQEEYGYTGDGSIESLQAEYSASELEELYEAYEGEC